MHTIRYKACLVIKSFGFCVAELEFEAELHGNSEDWEVRGLYMEGVRSEGGKAEWKRVEILPENPLYQALRDHLRTADQDFHISLAFAEDAADHGEVSPSRAQEYGVSQSQFI